jgi:hypothetical protein
MADVLLSPGLALARPVYWVLTRRIVERAACLMSALPEDVTTYRFPRTDVYCVFDFPGIIQNLCKQGWRARVPEPRDATRHWSGVVTYQHITFDRPAPLAVI